MKDYPVIKLILLFIIGLTAGFYFYISFHFLIICASVLLLISTFLYLLKNKISIYITPITIIICGASLYTLNNLNTAVYPFKDPKVAETILMGEIEEIELIKDVEIVLYINTDSLDVYDTTITSNLKFRCSIKDTNTAHINFLYDNISPGYYAALKGTIRKARDKRNAGEFDYYEYLSGLGIHGTFYTYSTDNVLIYKQSKTISSIIHSIRRELDYRIKSFTNRETSLLLRGLLLADRSEISYETKETFINSGVIHVLAVSGLHVGFITLIFYVLFSRVNIKFRYVITIAGTLVFMIITGSSVSVVRASIMLIAVIIGMMNGRTRNIFNSLALAGFIILLINPNELFNPGFQLSFSAVFSIIYFYPKIEEHLIKKIEPEWVKNTSGLFFVSLSAFIGTLPFTLYYFHKLSLISLIANIFVIPLIGVLVGLGILILFLSYIFPILSLFLGSAANFIVMVLYRLIEITSSYRFSYIQFSEFSKYDFILYVLTLFLLLYIFKNKGKIRNKIILTVLLITALYYFEKFDNNPVIKPGILNIIAIDIGQGDSFLITFPNGENALIDAGDANEYFDNGERVIIPLLKHLGVDKINYGIITHADADHYGGFLSIVKAGIIKNIFKPSLDTANHNDVNLEKYLNENRVKITHVDKRLMNIGGTRLYFLNRNELLGSGKITTNEKSVIVKLVYGKTSILFTGDATRGIEKNYVEEYGDFLQSDILKISHHGSNTGTNNLFLEYVKPEYALISAGVGNRFNHPSLKVLERLNQHGIKQLRTDLQGMVVIYSDGNDIKLYDWRNN